MSDEHDGVLDGLAETWRQEQPPSLDGLRRRVRRAARGNRLSMVVELAVGMGAVLVGGWLAVTGSWLVGSATILFGAFGLVVSLVTRAGASPDDMSTVADALEAAIAQTRRQRKVALGGIWVCVGALVFLAAVGVSRAVRMSSSVEGLEGLVRSMSAGALVVAVALGFVAVMLTRSQRRLASLYALRARLQGEEPEAAD